MAALSFGSPNAAERAGFVGREKSGGLRRASAIKPLNLSLCFLGNNSLEFSRAHNPMGRDDHISFIRFYYEILPKNMPFLLLLIFMTFLTGGRVSLLAVRGTLFACCPPQDSCPGAKLAGGKGLPLSKDCALNGCSCLSVANLFS